MVEHMRGRNPADLDGDEDFDAIDLMIMEEGARESKFGNTS
jgi:hypothetical protein